MATILFYSFVALCLRIVLDGIFIGLMAAGQRTKAHLLGIATIPFTLMALPASILATLTLKLAIKLYISALRRLNQRAAAQAEHQTAHAAWYRATDISAWQTHRRLLALPNPNAEH